MSSTYEITYFNNFHDTSVATSDHLLWPELIELFSKHEIYSNKDSTMFNLCTFKDKSGLDLGIRCSNNVDCYHGLILDYDGAGATVENIIMRFAEFTHIGYTSYNHKIKGVDKFRVILPFAEPCSHAEWTLRKENFLEFAGPEIDRSCVSHSRSFYLPSCAQENIEFADAWHVTTDILLDWNWFVPVVRNVNVEQVVIPLSVSDLQRALDELRLHKSILPNEDRYWLVRAVAKHVGAHQAIIECRSRWPDAAYNGKYEKQVKNLKDDGPGMGSIIFEIRKFNPNYEVMSAADYKLAALQQHLQDKYNLGEK